MAFSDKLKIMLGSGQPGLVRQALELILQLVGLEEIQHLGQDLIKPDQRLQQHLKVNWKLRHFLGRTIPTDLQQAVLY